MHYCIGDVHSCLDELTAVIEKIYARDPEPVIYLMGDIIDQGPKMAETLKWAMENVTEDGPIRCLRGNHEEEVLLWYRKYLEWQSESVRTLFPPESKYDFYRRLQKECDVTEELLDRIANFFHSLRYSDELVIDAAPETGRKKVHYYLAHAWYSVSEEKDSERQRWINLYGRSCDGISPFELKKYESMYPDEIPVVVCGHTPTLSAVYVSSKSDVPGVNRPGMTGYRPHAIFTDGGCFHYGRVPEYPCMLCAVCLETLEEIYPSGVSTRMTSYKVLSIRKEQAKLTKEAVPALSQQNLKKFYEKYYSAYLTTENPFRTELLSFLPSSREGGC